LTATQVQALIDKAYRHQLDADDQEAIALELERGIAGALRMERVIHVLVKELEAVDKKP
jgi:hypothetical protein